MKTCKDCKQQKDFSEFNKKGSGYQHHCRVCQRKWYKNYYNSVDKERKRLYSNNVESRDRIRKITRDARDRPCMDCGQSYPYYVMDFDHRDPANKEFTVARMVSSNMSPEKVLKEIEKCDVVCANCHRIRTHSGVV
jgi:hypothetical protein